MKQKKENNIPLKVIYLEDSPRDVELVSELLMEAGCEIRLDCAENKVQFTSMLRNQTYDIILSDFTLPDLNALEALHLQKEICPEVPFICISGSIGEETAIELIKQGAVDYVLKDRMIKLPIAIKRAIEETKEKVTRIQAENALKKSEARFRSYFELPVAGIAITSPSKKWIEVNNHLCSMLGYSREELLETTWSKLTHPDDLNKDIEQFNRVIKGEIDSYSLDKRFIRKDGIIIWTSLSVRCVRLENGNVDYFVSLYFDITDRKKIEESIRESEEKYRSIYENSSVGILLTVPDGSILSANDHACTLFGMTEKEFCNKRRQDVVDITDPRLQKLLEERKNAGKARGELTFIRKDGTKFEGEISSIIFRDKEGKEKTSMVIQDLTERKAAEKRIAEQARLLEIAMDAIIVRDMEDRLIFWNKSAEKLYGWTFEEACSDNLRLLVIDEDKVKYEKYIQEFMEKGEWEGELHKRTKNNRIILTHSRWTLVRDKEGKPSSRLIIDRDITEQRELEAKFRRAQRMESLGTLAGGIAHDLNNVLAPILMATQILIKKSNDPQIKEIAAALETNTLRGRDIIKQVLMFARGAEEGYAPQQLRYIIDEMRSIIRETFPRNITLRINIAENLKAVFGDATQLHQVLMNLCVNARDAMPNGGQLRITANNFVINKNNANLYGGLKQGDYILLNVSDNGTGIPEVLQEKVFDPFFTTKESGKGTGLGLSTVYGIVRDHKGLIKLSSKVGSGTEFSIYLPAAIGEKISDVVEDVTNIQPSKGESILLVDDESTILQISKETLELYGYKVITAKNGFEAITLFHKTQKGQVHLVIMDFHMPVMDGLATITAFRQIDTDIKIILSSGTISETDAEILSALKNIKRLVKPYTAQKLLETVRSVLNE